MTYVNADGNEGEMCGNGARCVAWRAADLGLAGPRLAMATGAGRIAARVAGRHVTLGLTEPKDLRPAVPLAVADQWLEAHYVDAGVPHAVVFVADRAALEALDVVGLGRELRRHTHFAPRGANANFVAQIGPSRLAIRTYERGVEDETLACGTGAVAAAIVAHASGKVRPPVGVEPRGGGILEIGFTADANGYRDVTLAGPTELIATGEIDNDWLLARGLPLVAADPKAMTSAGQLEAAG
jgi:diaminopimelate epimerase